MIDLVKNFYRRNINKIVLAILGLCFGLFVTEIALRIISPSKFYVWPPNLKRIFKPSPEITPGISGESRFYINSEGIRGDEFSDIHNYRILTVGGSTTECLYLDQTEAWPYILQQKLNNLKTRAVWVGNIGKSGLSTRSNIFHMKYMLPQYPKINCVIVLVGFNDFMGNLGEVKNNFSNITDKETYNEIEEMRWAFYRIPFNKRPFSYKSTVIWFLARRLKDIIEQREKIQDPLGNIYQKLRKKRQDALEILETLPDLQPALQEYARNINIIIDLAQNNLVRLIFLTQPSIWREDLSLEEKNLLWWGDAGDGKYYSAGALNEGMDKFNAKIIEICRLRGIEYIDLAHSLAKDTSVFYDDAHFNENGSRLVAEAVFKYLSSRAPFNTAKK